jgi:hypothetical protein
VPRTQIASRRDVRDEKASAFHPEPSDSIAPTRIPFSCALGNSHRPYVGRTTNCETCNQQEPEMIFSPRESRLRPFRNTSRWLAYLEGARLRSCGSDPQTGGTWQGNQERSALDARTDQYCHRHRKHSRSLTRAGSIWTLVEADVIFRSRPLTFAVHSPVNTVFEGVRVFYTIRQK